MLANIKVSPSDLKIIDGEPQIPPYAELFPKLGISMDVAKKLEENDVKPTDLYFLDENDLQGVVEDKLQRSILTTYLDQVDKIVQQYEEEHDL